MNTIQNIEMELRAKNFFAAKSAIQAAISAKTFRTDKEATEWVSNMSTPAKMSQKEFQAFVTDHSAFMVEVEGKKVWSDAVGPNERAKLIAIKSLGLVDDLMNGTLDKNPVAQKAWGENIKAIGGLFTQPESYPVLATFSSWQAPADLDMDWMKCFATQDLRGAKIGKIVDMIGAAKFKELLNNQPIEYSNLGYDTAIDVTKRIFGGGHAIDMDMIGNNPAVTLNMAFSSLRLAAEAKKAEVGYTSIYTDFTGTELYATSVLNTINVAGKTLKSRIADAKVGVTVSKNSLLYLVTNPLHEELVEQALSSIKGSDGTNPVIIHNIETIYSYYIPTTLGGKKAAHLILPGQKNINAMFQDLTTNQETHFDRQCIKVAAIEKYNITMHEPKQNIRVNLEA